MMKTLDNLKSHSEIMQARLEFYRPELFLGTACLNGIIGSGQKIEGDISKEESYKLMIKFMRKQNTETWNRILKMY